MSTDEEEEEEEEEEDFWSKKNKDFTATQKHTHIGPSAYQEWWAPRWFSSSVSPIASSESSHPCTEEEEEEQQQQQKQKQNKPDTKNKQQSLLTQTTPKPILQNDGEH